VSLSKLLQVVSNPTRTNENGFQFEKKNQARSSLDIQNVVVRLLLKYFWSLISNCKHYFFKNKIKRNEFTTLEKFAILGKR
jgi:hypothetical protein